MTRFNRVKLFFILPLFLVSAVASTNFTGCLDTFRAGNDPTGGTDYFGEPVNNSRDAVALTYGKCVSLCGSGQEPFDWSVFGQQFSAWLLPWLALVSQLPFGAMTSLENFISGVFLHRSSAQISYGDPQLPSLSVLRPSQYFPSPSQPSTPVGLTIVSQRSSTPMARKLQEPSFTSNRSRFS